MKEGLCEDLLALFLPEGILDYFNIVSYPEYTSGNRISKKQSELTLEEKGESKLGNHGMVHA